MGLAHLCVTSFRWVSIADLNFPSHQMLGGMGVAMWDFEHSYLYVDAAGTSLPCNDQLWVSGICSILWNQRLKCFHF